MAITLKMKETESAALLKLFDIDSGLIQSCEEIGVEVSVGTNALQLKCGPYVENVKMNLGAVTLAKQGKLGAFSKDHLKQQIQQAISNILAMPPQTQAEVQEQAQEQGHAQVYKEAEAYAQAQAEQEVAAENKMEAKAQVQPKPTAAKKKKATLKKKLHAQNYGESVAKTNEYGESVLETAGVTAEKDYEYDEDNGDFTVAPDPSYVKPSEQSDSAIKWAMNADPVPLYKAATMYQAVHGTSSSSRYFLIASGDEMKVACRIRNNRVSIRVEGNVEKHKKALKDAGLSDASGGHWSMHIDFDNDAVMARKIVGAVLCGLGITATTPLPNIKTLMNKGT